MIKDCPIHGHFEDIMAVDVEFFKHLEDVFPGRDIRAHNDEKLHHHGSSTIKHGRGSVLTIDLTNRCNMMCDPCFMDANQVGFVHELTWDDIKTLLDNAITIKPRRQMSVQFSGGEPTLSPYFLDAVRYARKVGYVSTQAATNGIEFAKSAEFAREAAAAGLRYAYLQFDGIGNAANSHRHVGNLFDVKLQAIENLYNNGVDIVPVTTLINGVNNEQVGSLIRFALDNPKKIPFLSFQPVSFTGRDEAVTRRASLRSALHAVAPRARREDADGARRARARLVPDLLSRHVLRLGGSHPRTRPRLGPVQLRLPPQLRCRHGGHGRQRDKGVRSRHVVPECRSARGGREEGHRRRPRPLPLGPRHGALRHAELQAVHRAQPVHAQGHAREVRQDLQRERTRLR